MYTYSTLSLRTWRMHLLLHVGASEPYAYIQDRPTMSDTRVR